MVVLSLEDCSHRLGGDGSLIGGLFPQAGWWWFSHWRIVPTGWVVMVLSLESCSHRLGGDGSVSGGLFPQEIYYEYMAGKKFQTT